MARMRVILVLLVAIAAGGGLAYGTYNYVRNVPASAASVATRPVVVAAVDLAVGAAIRPEDVRTIEWPAAALPAGVFEKTGRRRGPRSRDAPHPERAGSADEACVEGGGQWPADHDS